jgi:hypothetical protein
MIEHDELDELDEAEIERLAYEELAGTQRPHGMREALTVEELMALGEEEAVAAVEAREEEIRKAAEDPYTHGWFFRSWDDVLWELLDLRLANLGIPVEFLVAGSNGAGKSQMVARFLTLAMEQCELDWPEHQRTFWTFSFDDNKSAEVVESAVRFWQPLEYKTESGRMKKLASQKMGYDAAGGFTNNECAVQTGAVCRFKTWAQEVGKLEGPRPTTAWSDEAVPVVVLKAVKNRLLTAAERTHEMGPKWRELQAAKAQDGEMWFPRELIGRLLVAVHLVTYTFRDGYTDTVRYFMDEGTVMREIEADAELLPRRNDAGEVVGGERLPCLVHCKDVTKRVKWLYAWENPLGGNWAGMKRTEMGSTRAQKLWKCYGVAEGTADSPFPNFHVQVHVRPVPGWLPPAELGTWWMSQDPNASGGRAWFQLWGFVLGEAWNHLGPGDLIIAHEYPQVSDAVVVPGAAMYTGEDCLWARNGGKSGLGEKGPAQKQWPCGYGFRASEIRRIEAKLAREQGVTSMMGLVENTMIDVYGRRISDSRSTNTEVENQEGSKTIIEWLEENDLYFSQAGGNAATNSVLEGEQNINSMLMWDRENTSIDAKTGWMEVNPQLGRGPKIRIAERCTNLIGALQNYPGFSVPGASGSAYKDPIDTLRILLNAGPEHEARAGKSGRRGRGF